MTTNTAQAITLEDVTFAYHGQPALDRVNLQVRPNEFTWVVGPNGGGKTTLVKLILGLLRPQTGSVRVLGQPPAVGRLKVGYMPQHASIDLGFPLTVLDAVLMGRLDRTGRLGSYTSTDRAAAIHALETVDLGDVIKRSLSALSGGQLRRLLIARALATDPVLLLLDEPTANLDRRIERNLLELLIRLSEKMTVVMVSHDPAFVADFVKQVVCVNRTVSVHPTTDIKDDYVRELFGTSMRLVRHDLNDREHRSDRGPS